VELFSACQDEWEWFIPPMGGKPFRLRLNLSAVRDVADSHGLTWNWELVRRIKACAATILKEDRSAKVERKSPKPKKKRNGTPDVSEDE